MPVTISESNENVDAAFERTVVKGINGTEFEVRYKGSNGRLFYCNAIWTMFETIKRDGKDSCL